MIKMETKVFELPKHPTKGEQRIVVEKPAPSSVWYLVLEETKAIPLVNLEKPESAKQVLDELRNLQGEGGVAHFVMNGFSKVKVK